ncbi:hypothetical protein KJY73_21450 [Bowmanella sp. Y26]|nr:hypothetical protein [Bowmanella yangjiangensis]
MTSDRNTDSNTLRNRYQRYFDINMFYHPCNSNRLTGQRRRELCVIIAARFGIVSPIVISEVFQMTRRKALLFLNKLVDEKLLELVVTHRACDGRVYVLAYAGASYASELMKIDVPFRSSSHPSTQVNLNSVVHDSILSYVLLSGIQNCYADGTPNPLWYAFVSELEFRRLYPASAVKKVDGVVLCNDGSIAAVELENSFKRKTQHQESIYKFRDAIHGNPKLYDKVFFVGGSDKVFADTKRFHRQLLDELPHKQDRKKGGNGLSKLEADSLRDTLIFRTKFTSPITSLFYS